MTRILSAPTETIKFQPVGGTHDWLRWSKDAVTKTQWNRCDSPFCVDFMLPRGFECLRPSYQFWSGGLSGLPFMKMRTWLYGAEVAASFFKSIPYKDRNAFTLSHGGNVIALMCSLHDVKLRSLTTITMPVRKDMKLHYAKTKVNVGMWQHVYSKSWWRDRWQIIGMGGDKAFSFFGWLRGTARQVDDVPNTGIDDVGHSSLVRNLKHSLFLDQFGVLQRIVDA